MRPQSPVQITALGIIALPHSQERHARQHHEPALPLEKSIEPGRTHPIPPAFSPTEFLRRLRSAETLISFACYQVLLQASVLSSSERLKVALGWSRPD
jgi:hypothetical protein